MRPSTLRVLLLALVGLLLTGLWRTERDQVLQDRWLLALAACAVLLAASLRACLRRSPG